jgi:protein SCO1
MKPFFLVPVLAALLTYNAGAASTDLPAQLQNVGIDQHLNAQLPLDTVFKDESGQTVQLKQFFGSKPVLFAPVYYSCPMLCDQILSGVVTGLRPLSLQPGRDFEVVAMSINPADTPQDAKAKRDHFSQSYSSKLGPNGWHFLVGSQASINAVTKAIGFRYHWDAAHKMFVHASGIMVVTPQGRLARYFYGVEYEPKDLKLGLIEASHDQIGSVVDQILLFCYHYDPNTGKYGAVVINFLRILAVLVLLTLGSALFIFWRRDVKAGSVQSWPRP